MARIAALLAPGGRFFLSLRHGPVPDGRVMFQVTAEETAGHAAAAGLVAIHRNRQPSRHGYSRDAGVDWTLLGFERPR